MAARAFASPSLKRGSSEKPQKSRDGSTRILFEASRIAEDPPPGCSARIEGDNIRKWVGCIDGPENSCYAGGKFRFKMTLPPDYPYSPPQVRFAAKIYHPNIKSTGDHPGHVCIDILQKGKGWSPSLTIDRILLSVLSLFTDANPDHPLEKEIAREYKHDRERFELTAKEYTRKYAIEN